MLQIFYKNARTNFKNILLFLKLRQLLRYLIYFYSLGVVSAFLSILDEILGREVLRKINVKGTRLFVRTNTPDLDVAISSLFFKEYDEIRCESPKVILDAGGNIGTSAIFFAQKYPEARIFSIEPESGNYEILKKKY